MRPAVVLCVGFALVTFFSGCARPADGDPQAKLDPALRSLARTRPDSVTGVLVRIRPPLDEAARDSLQQQGLIVHAEVGDVLTGELRASAAAGIARMPFVVRVELARQVPVHRSTL